MEKKGFIFLLSGIVMMYAACTSTIGPKKAEAAPDYQKQFEAAYQQLQVAAPAVRQEKKPLVLVHYMPWYQAPPTSDQFGLHWHQSSSKFDPYEVQANGQANIASHYYPLTGPYDSKDVKLLEYQAALMKMAGIDGVIFDWYGITDGLDYKGVHEATKAMVEVVKRAGLKFAICYEDQSITHLIDFGIIDKTKALDTAKDTFTWMQQNWFNDEAYVKQDGRPVVLCFGPQRFNQKTEWDAVFGNVEPRPYFIDLDNRTSWADATYDWPPMWAGSGGKLTIPALVNYLNRFYEKQAGKPFLLASAFPGFHDIYAQAGGKSYGFLDYSDGETFKLTYSSAEQARADIIQIATWNDYGEGTIIEPTVERGYKELEYLQDNRKKWDEDFSFTYDELRIPIEFYKILVAENATDGQKRQVADAYSALFAGDVAGFRDVVKASGIQYDFSVSPILGKPTGGAQIAVAQAFDPAGRKNLALGKPVVVSGKIDVWVGTKAVDGDLATYWEGAANQYPAFIKVDLVAPNQLSTAVVKLNPQRMWGKRTERFAVQVSDDGDTFTELAPATDYVFDPMTNGNAVAIPLNVKARYVQLVFTANSAATSGQVAEFEVYGE